MHPVWIYIFYTWISCNTKCTGMPLPPLFTTDAVFTAFLDHRVDLINPAKLPELQLKFDDQITRD